MLMRMVFPHFGCFWTRLGFYLGGGPAADGGGVMLFENRAHFQEDTCIVLHSVVHMEKKVEREVQYLAPLTLPHDWPFVA